MKAQQCSLPREAAAFLTCSYSVSQHLCSQYDFHCILCHRGQMGICELVDKADNILFVQLVYI